MLQQVRKHCQSMSFQPSQTPTHKFDCTCDMCSVYQQKLYQNHNLRINNFLSTTHSRRRHKIQQRLHNPFLNPADQYLWLLKKLQLPSNKIVQRGIEFFIPEICFYRDGEPTALFLNRDVTDYTLKEIPKERLTNIFIRKTLNERRRKYRDKLAVLNRSELRSETKSNKKKPLNFQEKKKEGLRVDTKDAVVVRFLEGYEQLYNQTDFFALMEKRRKDSIFASLDFVRNYIQVKTDLKQTGIIKYLSTHITHPQLFSRASRLMRVYGTNILPTQPSYIPQSQQSSFCQHLQSTSLPTLFLYLTYKLVCFVSAFHDTVINKGTFHWQLDRFKRCLLMNAYKIEFVEGPKYDWTNEVIEEKNRKVEYETFYRREIEVGEAERVVADRMEGVMEGHYEGLKRYYGLSLKVAENTEEEENNKFFRMMHPQCKVDLSQGLILTKTAEDFKRVYLGYVKKKRPIVSQFKTSMLATLHNLTAKKKKSSLIKTTDDTWNHSNSNSPLKLRKTSRPNSTRASFKRTIERLDELNRSLNCFDS